MGPKGLGTKVPSLSEYTGRKDKNMTVNEYYKTLACLNHYTAILEVRKENSGFTDFEADMLRMAYDSIRILESEEIALENK